jgi:hypothetical protein
LNMADTTLVEAFFNSSEVASHPSVFVTIPKNFKIIGGGAVIHPAEASNFLTASYPFDRETWFAAGKDHEIDSPASITCCAYAIQDPDDIWDVQIFSEKSAVLSHPKVTAFFPDGTDYVLTGGGAFANYKGAGNMLNASFPSQPLGNGDWYAWNAHSKDHDISDPAELTAYVIGIRLRSAPLGSPGVQNLVLSATCPAMNKPSVDILMNLPHFLTGGGAWDMWVGAGNMLTACGPDPNAPTPFSNWLASGSDHITDSPASLTGWAIGLEFSDVPQTSRRIVRPRPHIYEV